MRRDARWLGTWERASAAYLGHLRRELARAGRHDARSRVATCCAARGETAGSARGSRAKRTERCLFLGAHFFSFSSSLVDAVNENRVADALASCGGDRRARRALLPRLVAAVGAAVETTGTARNVHVSIKSFVSSRLVRLALWLSLSRLSRRRLRVRRIPSQPRFGACSRSTGRRSRAPT